MNVGSLENNWSGGRPVEFDETFFETHMVPLIREARSRQKSASSRSLTSSIKKKQRKKKQKTKAGKEATGITAAFLKPILKKVAKDARKLLGPGPIKFLHDKAPCCQALVAEGDNLGFDGGIEMAAGKAPDMSHLDAGVCKVMEDTVEAEGAETADEIRAAVKKAWKKITPAFCERVSKRVFKNMGEVIRLKGGNFYTEAK